MTTEQELDTSNLGFRPGRDNENEGTVRHAQGSLPFDLPCVMRIKRHLRDEDKALLGWEMIMSFPYRADVSIKIGRESGLNILVDGEIIAKIPPKRDLTKKK